MKSAASSRFLRHISEVDEAITVYGHLLARGYDAKFNLRFVWIYGVSALDDYVTQLILEVASEKFSDGKPQTQRLLNETAKIQDVYQIIQLNSPSSVIDFRSLLSRSISYITFQSPEAIADGLSFIWTEKDKWRILSAYLGMKPKAARRLLGNIVARRNLIAHNADYDDFSASPRDVNRGDAIKTRMFLVGIVYAIEDSLT
jgi:hypothetical protein